MKKQHIKKTNTNGLLPKRKLLKKLLVTTGLLLGFSYGSVAQTNTTYGTDALRSFTSGGRNAAFGYRALYSNTEGDGNTANGLDALYSNTKGNLNTASGIEALYSNTTGNLNTASGNAALRNNTIAWGNTANGNGALFYNIEGWENTASGFHALYRNKGHYNTANGASALVSNIAGINNTALGFYADVASGNLTNATAIGAKAIVNTSNTIQLGDNAVTKVYAGVGNTATLVAGGLQITGGTPAAGKVLTSDASGLATWQTPAVTGWGLTGNASTVDGTHFIGTTDPVPFNIRVNNQKAGKIDANTNNTLYGYQAGNSNKGGWGNTANGYQALYSNTDGFANIANGAYALYKNTTGSSNIATGYQALVSNTEGGANIAYGNDALGSNTKGDHNIAVGHYALYSNETGHRNVAVGHYALYTNKDGVYNTAIGVDALKWNVSGGENTASGHGALASNTKGGGNTATGSHTLFSNTGGGDNTASGSHALHSNINGGGNTANGYLALYANVDGNFNTALGTHADVTSANLTNATAIGYNAKVSVSNTIQLGDNAVTKVYAGVDTNARLIAGGLQITGGTPATGKVLTSDATGIATWQSPASTGWSLTGNTGTIDSTNFIGTTDNIPFNIRVNNQKAGRIDANNAFYGYQSGNARTTGGYNTANGYQALYANTTGDGNTAVGDRSLLANTSGNYNTAVGSLALSTSTKGKYNTAVGYNANIADKDGAGKDITNATAIGAGAVVNASNKIRLGDESITIIEGRVMFTPSDERFKTSINEADVKGLEFVKKLRPVVYNFDTKKFQAFLTQNMPADVRKEYMNKDFSASTAIRQSGFIAQEVEKAAQEIGYDFNGLHKPENANDNYSLAYSQFVVPLVKAVQEQQQQIEKQEKVIEEQQKENQQQQQKMDQLQQRIEALEKRMAGNSNLSNEPVNKITTSSEAEGLKLFPNPTTGVFTIMANHITNATIEVYDMLGNSVKKEMFANIKSGYKLDLSGHAKGTYWVNIISGNKKYTKQIVVQ